MLLEFRGGQTNIHARARTHEYLKLRIREGERDVLHKLIIFIFVKYL